jgi:hypothetical protein
MYTLNSAQSNIFRMAFHPEFNSPMRIRFAGPNKATQHVHTGDHFRSGRIAYRAPPFSRAAPEP